MPAMKRQDFIKKISLMAAFTAISPLYSSSQEKKKNMTIRLLRNATLLIEINNKKLLIDPLLAPKSTYDPIIWTSNGIRNPTVDLPIGEKELEKIISSSDAVLVTHTHNDHWDISAQQLIPKDKLIMGQPEDEAKFKKQGFTNIKSVQDTTSFEGISITRTKGHHGKGEIGEKMAPVSGFIIKDGKLTLYIAGDTIWCKEVAEAIQLHQPEFIVLNAGGAKFDMGDPIIMDKPDVLEVCRISKAKKIICVHMEALNHCYLKRDDLKQALKEAGEYGRCIIPADGEEIELAS